MKIRKMQIEDYDELILLWQKAGLPFRPKGRDRKEKIAIELGNSNSIFLVAEIESKMVGVIFGTHDGRKGWINRLAIDENYRNRGIARKLVDEVEKQLLESGIEIVTCLIEDWNTSSKAVFKKLGFKAHPDITYFAKRMKKDV